MAIKNNVFDFQKIFSSEETYEKTKNSLKEAILNDFSIRKQDAKIKLGTVIDTNFGFVLVNLLIMKPFVNAKNHILTEKDLFTYDAVTEDTLEKYFNNTIKICKSDNANNNEISKKIKETIDEMASISGSLTYLAGNSISFYDFVRLSANNPEATKLFSGDIYTKEQSSLKFDEVETKFNKRGNDLIKLFNEDTTTELHPFVKANTGINKKQLTQALGFIGLKPSISGEVIPVVIEDNFLHGLSNIENYFINCEGTRNALIQNSKFVRRSGYFTRKISLSNIDNYHNADYEDCGTKHFIKFKVDSEKKLIMIIGRHYYKLDDSGNKVSDELFTIDGTEKNLIGTVIGLRSPVTCARDEHGHVCATCYGKQLAEVNRNRQTGLVATFKLTEPLTQMLLSAKHLLGTKTEKISWGNEFLNTFEVNMDSIYFLDPEAEIKFSGKDLIEDDDNSDGEFYLSASLFGYKPEAEDDFIKLIPNKIIIDKESDYYNEETDTYTISAKSFGEDDPVFTFNVKNNELIKSLQEILNLIESSNHGSTTEHPVETYHDLVNRFDDLLIENGLNYINSVHIEMISSMLIRNKEGKLLDFRKDDEDPYEIIRVSKSILEGPLATTLAFERLSDQLTDISTYDKNESSLMDCLFK